jgi:hypothetical protein
MAEIYAGGNRGKAPRWSHVGSIFSCGSGRPAELCRRFEVDPDEEVGLTEWELAERVLGELDEETWRSTFGCEPPPEDER